MADEVIDGDAIEIEEIAGQELVIHEERESSSPPASVLPSPKEWEATLAVAREIAATQFVPESYRGRPESVVAAILTGREMGIGPMQSLRQIHMIDGRPAFAADLMMAKMRKGGLVVVESEVTSERAYIKARRKDTGEEAEVEWTTADAEAANLLGKKNWKTYRSDMLWARAVGRLARRLGSDLLGGLVYSKEEMEDWDDGGYGGGSGYEATTERPFDPARDLLPNAISGDDARARISSALNQMDETVEWSQVIAQATTALYGTAEWRSLPDGKAAEFWRRLSNVVAWIDQTHSPGDIRPVPEETIVAAFAYAFSGVEVNVTYEEAEAAPLTAEQAAKADAAEDDVPFGE